MATKKKGPVPHRLRLGGKKHEHPLQPLEYGHPVTVTPADIPAGLTTENVAVVQMGGQRFTTLNQGDFPFADWLAAFEAVKERYSDCFDFVVFFTDPRLPRITYSGYHRGVHNEVSGIGRGALDSRQNWGSERLQSQIWMGRFSLGTLLQEIGHRWGAFVDYRMTPTGALQNDLTLADGAHWARAFDDGSSPVDYDEERHIRQTPTTWLREPVPGLEFRFCGLDLYLMGLKSRIEAGNFTLIQDYTEIGAPLPGGRQMVKGNARDLTVKNIVWAEGTRSPTHQQSQKHFRAAFVVITRDASRLDDMFVKQVEVLRRQLEQYFPISTENRAFVDAGLDASHAISRSGTVDLKLKADKIVRSRSIYHGLGPIPVKVELGLETTVGASPIDSWYRLKTPDIAAGVQHLEAQVNRDPYAGTFVVVAQAKGADLTLKVRWVATEMA